MRQSFSIARSIRRSALLVAGSLLVAPIMSSSALANTLAFDDAANSAYSDGWQTGDNDGSGFGAWTLGGGSNSGQFIYTATDNGGFGAAAGGATIDSSGKSWGLYANSGQTADAVRAITAPLNVGETFSIGMDNGWIDYGSVVGFGLQDGNQNRLEFYFVGGHNDYSINDAIGEHDTSVGWTDTGLNIAFTLTGADTYSLAVTPLGGTTSTFTGALAGTAGSKIDGLRIFNFNAGGGDNYNAFFNTAEVTAPAVAVPLPSAAWMGLAGLGAMLVLRESRKRLNRAIA